MRRSRRILLTGASCAAGLAVALGVSACGSGSGEAAAKISTAAGGVSVTRETGTRTEGSASTPVAETVTTTETVRETTPAQSLTVQKNVNAVVSTASTPTTTTEPADSGGMPWWGWALIAAGVAAVAVLLARRGRGKPSGEQVEARREAVVTSWTAQGWAVVSESDDSAVLARNGERILLTVDESGHVASTELDARAGDTPRVP